ncbi:hypothetical protein EJ04DRAFT_557018 [Polyplosphaeria fusca]|uniref:Uncharacterized protein n=1 Tax=Polyplosphaeria fusca TaxID=682080 RepID=A0A9P4QNH2_9PLEO|nr:hypothetical protein EJ04DRAFT_557018 [Polyplosphaeria fusca]
MLPSSIAPAPFDQQLPSAHASQPSQRSLAALNELRAQVQALTPSTGYDLGRSQARLQAPTQTQATFTQDWAPRVQPRHRRRLDQGPEPSAADIYPEDFEGYESNSSFESPSIYLPLGAPASQYQQAHATQTQIQHGRAQSFMPQFQVPPPVQQPGLSQRQGPVQGRGVQPAQARIHQGGSRSSYVPPPGDLRALYGSLPLPLPPTAGPPQARIPRAGSQPSYAPTPGDLRSLHDTLPLPTIGGPPNTSTQIPLNSSQEDKKYGFVVNGIGHGRDWNPPYEEPTPQFRTRPGEGSLKSIWDKPEGKVSSTPGTALLRHDNFWDGHERGGPAIKELWEKPFPPVMPTQSFDPLNPTSPARNVLLQDPNFLREEMDRLKSSMPPLLPDRRIWGEPSAPTQTSSSQETGPQQRGSWSRLDLWGPRPVGSGTRSPSSTSSTSTARPPRAAGTADTAGGASPTPSAGGRGAADPAGDERDQRSIEGDARREVSE